MKLFFRVSGKGQPLIILHGLFGSSDNWYSLSKVFAEQFQVYVVDQRNHGQSPHDTNHDYKSLTSDLYNWISENEIKNPIIIGHSMGGKTAMNFAVKHPNLVQKLIIVDIVPKNYPVHHDSILEGLQAIDLSSLKSRTEADQTLSHYVNEPDVRQFLLKNLSRDQDQNFEWKINIPVLANHIEDMGAGVQFEGKYSGPTLFILGKKSNYFQKGDEKVIHKYFPNAELSFLDTGHWVQAEDPAAFTKTVTHFLQSTS